MSELPVGYLDADIIRLMIRHEDEQINRRMTWFCTIQGLLFAALAFSWKPSSAKLLVYVLAALGIVVAVSIVFAIMAALSSINDLRSAWENMRPKDFAGPPVSGRPQVQRRFPAMRPALVVPWGFVVGWVYVVAAKIAS